MRATCFAPSRRKSKKLHGRPRAALLFGDPPDRAPACSPVLARTYGLQIRCCLQRNRPDGCWSAPPETSARSRVSPQGRSPCKSPVFRLYYQGICLLGACQALFFLRCFACYFAARGAFTGMAPLFMPSLVLECTP